MVLTEEEKKERRKEYNKKYYKKHIEKNKGKYKEYQKEYNKTPKGKKINTIKNWKRIGLIHDNYEELYDKYLNTTECNVCKYVFDNTNWRCLDHDHETGLFRQILCNSCNVQDNWKNKKNYLEH